MGQLLPLSPALANPMVNNLDVHFDLSKSLLKRAQGLNAGEGYIFKNLEKDGKKLRGWILTWPNFVSADYPYINYYVINKSREEAGQFYTENKQASHEELNASKSGWSVAHTMDLYDEVKNTFMLFNILFLNYLFQPPWLIHFSIFFILIILACKPACGRHMLGCQPSAGTGALRVTQKPYGPVLRILWWNHTHSVYYI